MLCSRFCNRALAIQGWVRRQLVAHLTLLIGIFCAFSQVTGALHWVIVEHTRCAEHSEWVHVGEGNHAHSYAPTPTASLSVQAASADEHAHDHCDFLRTPRESTLAPSARASLPLPWVIGSFGQVRCSDSKAPLARYELAPKTSPPGYAS